MFEQEKLKNLQEKKVDKESEKKEETVSDMLDGLLDKISQNEKINGEDDTFSRSVWKQGVLDIKEVLDGDGEENPENILIAYRGFQELEKGYSLKSEEIDLEEVKNKLKEKFEKQTDCRILEEVEDLDMQLENSPKGSSEYFRLKAEIEKKRQEILGDSRSFYKNFSKKIMQSFGGFGEKMDRLTLNSKLLKFIGEHALASKTTKGIALGVVAMFGLSNGFSGDLAEASVFDITEDLTTSHDSEYGEKEIILESSKSNAFLSRVISETGANDILESDEFQQAKKPQEIDKLYQSFNEKDKNPSDDLAVACKYEELLRDKSTEELVHEYGKDVAEKIYQQGGYSMFKAMESCFNLDIQDGEVSSADLNNYLSGFEQASNFYRHSLELTENPTNGSGELHKALKGILEMAGSVDKIANTVVIYGDDNDKLIAAEMRNLVQQNLSEFERIENSEVEVVGLGNGKFLFPNTRKMVSLVRGFIGKESDMNEGAVDRLCSGWIKDDAGGFCAFSSEMVDYFNKKDPSLWDQNDRNLSDLLLSFDNLKFENGKYISNPEKSSALLFTTIKMFTHENQHHEFIQNAALSKYWINEWNDCDPRFRFDFIKSLTSYRNYTNEQIRQISEKPIDYNEIFSYTKNNGLNMSREASIRYEAVQEYFAYSTDNNKSRLNNTNYEIP